MMYQVRGDDNQSISESISNSFISKKGLPTLFPNQQPQQDKQLLFEQQNQLQQTNQLAQNNTIQDLLDKIDSMNNGFEEPSTDDIDPKEFDLFRENVKKWVDADNLLTELDKKRKELTKIRNNYNEDIIRFMKRYKVDDININDHEKLKFESKQSKAGYNKKNIQEMVHNYFIQNADVANKLLEFLDQNRQVKERDSIRRTKPG